MGRYLQGKTEVMGKMSSKCHSVHHMSRLAIHGVESGTPRWERYASDTLGNGTNLNMCHRVTCYVLDTWTRVDTCQTSHPGSPWKAACANGWQPYHLHVPTVLKAGSLDLLEPSGPLQELLYLLPLLLLIPYNLLAMQVLKEILCIWLIVSYQRFGQNS